MQNGQELLARRGLTLAKQMLRSLERVGIFAQASVSLEHQHLAGKYVVRGVESGGAIEEIGRYVTFCGGEGEPLPYLHPVDAIGVNGVHAVVVGLALVRIELFRAGRTCQLLITKHQPGTSESGERPQLENTVVFRGVNGFLEGGPAGDEDYRPGKVLPRFWSRRGEERKVPPPFVDAARAATRGATCVGCSHAHYLVAPLAIAANREIA